MKRAVSGLLLSLFLFITSPATSRSTTFSDFEERNHPESLQQTGNRVQDINPRALDMALKGYYNLKRQGLIRRAGILTLIDFDKPSVTERLYIIDVDNGTVLQSALVAHGQGSGEVMATRFSNRPGSKTSSLGFYLTDTTYSGKNGYSLVLKGLDHGLNDKAEKRSIVMHGADYVSQEYISRYGRLGRSQGCPAISFGNCQQLIDTIKDGTCLFIYHTGNDYASKSGERKHRTASRHGRQSHRA
jgi:hypothetical protein